jgi:hypothetical protein
MKPFRCSTVSERSQRRPGRNGRARLLDHEVNAGRVLLQRGRGEGGGRYRITLSVIQVASSMIGIVSVAIPAHFPKPACGPPRKPARMVLPMTSQGIISPVNRAYQYHVISGRAALKSMKSPIRNGSRWGKCHWQEAPPGSAEWMVSRDQRGTILELTGAVSATGT